MIATFIRALGGVGLKELYELDPPLKGHRHVVVSGINARVGKETTIFATTPEGDVLAWDQLPGSFQGGINIEEALHGAGYTVVRERRNGKPKTRGR
jgi:hypothetical protein